MGKALVVEGKTGLRRNFPMRPLCLALLLILVLPGCEPSERDRPYGLIRLGSVADLWRDEIFLEDQRIYLRHDERGFSGMSAMCTHDISHLELFELKPGMRGWRTTFNPSIYKITGELIAGPATRPLPYYELQLHREMFGQQEEHSKDGSSRMVGGRMARVLYVFVGKQVPASWRLLVPELE